MIRFPKPLYMNELMKNPKITSKYPVNYSITLDELEKSLIAFNVYYKDLKYTKISQTAKANIEDLVSDLGGLLGLFIGVSFMSIMEIFGKILNRNYLILISKTIFKYY
jgi:hypothetical protein